MAVSDYHLRYETRAISLKNAVDIAENLVVSESHPLESQLCREFVALDIALVALIVNGAVSFNDESGAMAMAAGNIADNDLLT